MLFRSDDEHSFTCLLAFCMSSLEKYLFRSSAHFSEGIWGFLLLSCMSCLYILEINPNLVVATFATIFSHDNLSFRLLRLPWDSECIFPVSPTTEIPNVQWSKQAKELFLVHISNGE